MHSLDETVDEEDVALQQLSLIKTSDGADGDAGVVNSSRRSICCSPT